MAIYGGELTVTGVAQNLATVLGLTDDAYSHGVEIDIYAPSTNTGNVAVGRTSAVTVSANRIALIEPGRSFSPMAQGSGNRVGLAELWVIGPGTSEVIFVAAVA